MPALLNKIGGFTSEFGAEIAAYDTLRQELYVVSGGNEVQVFDLSDPTDPVLGTIYTLTDFVPEADGANSIAASNGIVAIAIELDNGTDNDIVGLIDIDEFLTGLTAGTPAGIQIVPVGSLPDMLTFTPDGTKVVVANEGEPNDEYTDDPVGSVSIIDLSGGVGNATVATAGFEGFNDQKDALIAEGIRIFGPNASVAQDLEPEYIAISGDGATAVVTLQENNAIAIVDIATATVTDIVPLGAKDFSLPENQLDASNEDGPDGEGAINIRNWPVFGQYQPDAIASYVVDGSTYYVTANEGDARDYDGFSEEARVKDLGDPEEGLGLLDPTVFPNAEELQDDANLGRLKITTTLGDIDGDGDYDQIWGYGARSFSIWDEAGNLVFDSGDDFATITTAQVPELFNGQGDADSFDSRSDDKGAEPEAVTIGVVDGKTLAFIGLERIGGVMVYDVTAPTAPEFVEYQPNAEGDIAPEGLVFIPAADSPNGENLLISANEVSSTLAVYQVGRESDTDGGTDGGTDGSTDEVAVLDFEGFDAGTVITDQFAGVTVSTNTQYGAMLFDTNNPTGGDEDLRASDLDNVLIISEDGNSDNPDDNATGGTISFEWDELTNVKSVSMLDVDEPNVTLTFYDVNGDVIDTVEVPNLGDNSFQTLNLGISNVAAIDVNFAKSGAIANIEYMVATDTIS